MTNSQRLAAVRARLTQWLESHRDPSESPEEYQILRESILVRNQFYCGRRFHTAHHDAVWFIEEDELKIYESDGHLAAVFKGEQIDQESTDAAANLPASETLPTIVALPMVSDESGVNPNHERSSRRHASHPDAPSESIRRAA